jgi:tripeptidyl-peptidase-1
VYDINSLKVFEHSDTKKTHIACDEYSVPVDIKTHIDFITPTIGFDAYLREPKKSRSLSKRDGAPQPVDGTPPINDTVAGSVKPISGAVVGDPQYVQLHFTCGL